MTLTTIFLKTYGEDTLRCPYKNYSSLRRWQANMDLFSVFTFCILLSVMTHLCQGKKVSILVPSDVNSGPVASRRVGADIRRATSHDHVPGASRDPEMSCAHFHKT
jgi:hypothetical protein